MNRDQEVYVGAEFYNSRMYASACKDSTKGKVYLYQGSTRLSGLSFSDGTGFGKTHFDTLAKGTYTIKF